MADGKWLPELTADTTLTEAARRALQARLQVVREHLPLVAVDMPRHPEHVHQLRVGTRRAGAALRIFACCLPNKLARKANQRLRELRRTAGASRDWDVFSLSLRDRRATAAEREHPGLDYLLGYAGGQRAAAQLELLTVARKQGERFESFIDRTLAAVSAPAAEPDRLLSLARPLLAQLLQELEEQTNGELTDYAQLHQVRIAGKRLRYAMELFAGCFDDSFQETLYPRIEEMQEVLGRANDSHVAVERLETIRTQGRATLGTAWKLWQPGFMSLLQFHRRRLPRERRTFLAWWAEWQQSGSPALNELLDT